MNTFSLIPTCNKTSNQSRGFIPPPQHCRGGTSASAGGFSFGIFAPVGAIQLKEVASAKAGINLYRSTIAFQSFLRKESTL